MAELKIYQIKNIGATDYAFRDWNCAKANGFTLQDYRKVYEGTRYGDRTYMLENIFREFNIERPADFTGHSLSVSDVVALKDEEKWSWYYCDDIGWQEITETIGGEL